MASIGVAMAEWRRQPAVNAIMPSQCRAIGVANDQLPMWRGNIRQYGDNRLTGSRIC